MKRSVRRLVLVTLYNYLAIQDRDNFGCCVGGYQLQIGSGYTSVSFIRQQDTPDAEMYRRAVIHYRRLQTQRGYSQSYMRLLYSQRLLPVNAELK